jgi:YD repeat-containing protein
VKAVGQGKGEQGMKDRWFGSRDEAVARSAYPLIARRLRRALSIATLGSLLLCASGSALAGSVGYTYDTLGRLKTVTYSNGVVVTYTYDAAGNRSSRVTSGA